MFLFKEGAQQHFSDEQFYNFSPYQFGPFSQDIYYDLEALERRGLVEIERDAVGKRRSYAITPQGESAALKLRDEHRRAYGYLANLTRWVIRKFSGVASAKGRTWVKYLPVTFLFESIQKQGVEHPAQHRLPALRPLGPGSVFMSNVNPPFLHHAAEEIGIIASLAYSVR
jgi:hypothetical protein